jgi:hypothetical protein
VVIVEGLLRAAIELEDAGTPYDVLGRLYESFAQAMLIRAGVTVDLIRLCGFDNPSAIYGSYKPGATVLIHCVAGKASPVH